ncbi:MAG: hypothetical protein RSA70_07175, partial [Clostridia bacterium]
LLPPVVDTLGREVLRSGGDNSIFNVFFNPANVAKNRETPAGREFYDVYKATGDKTVMPRVAPYYLDVGGEKVVLTPEQKVQYQKKSGQTAERIVSDLLHDDSYTKKSAEDKAQVLKDIVDYSDSVARKEILSLPMPAKHYSTYAAKEHKLSEATYLAAREALALPIADGTANAEEAGQKKFVKMLPVADREHIEKTKKNESINDIRRLVLMRRNDLTPAQKAYIDKSTIGEQKTPTDYKSEDAFYLSQMNEAKRERYSAAKDRWDMPARDYYNIIDACSGLRKKDDIVDELKKHGLYGDAPYRFYYVVFAPKKKE